MAHIIKVTPVVDGPKKAVFHVYLESDGKESELKDYVLIDSKTSFFNSNESARNIVYMSVTQVWYSFAWFDARLNFDGFMTADDVVTYPSWVLPRDATGYYDLRYFGGLKDRSLDGQGKILLTTNGFSEVGSIGTMVLEVRKD